LGKAEQKDETLGGGGWGSGIRVQSRQTRGGNSLLRGVLQGQFPPDVGVVGTKLPQDSRCRQGDKLRKRHQYGKGTPKVLPGRKNTARTRGEFCRGKFSMGYGRGEKVNTKGTMPVSNEGEGFGKRGNVVIRGHRRGKKSGGPRVRKKKEPDELRV